jgi:hypothetical protein
MDLRDCGSSFGPLSRIGLPSSYSKEAMMELSPKEFRPGRGVSGVTES